MWCHCVPFIFYQITLQLLCPPSAKWHKSLMLLVALWKIRPQWSKNNQSFQHFTSSGDALRSTISEPLQSHMMILGITYLFSACWRGTEVEKRKKWQDGKKGASSCHKHASEQTLTHFWSSFDVFHFLTFTLVKEWHCMIWTFSSPWYYASGCVRFRSVKEKTWCFPPHIPLENMCFLTHNMTAEMCIDMF